MDSEHRPSTPFSLLAPVPLEADSDGEEVGHALPPAKRRRGSAEGETATKPRAGAQAASRDGRGAADDAAEFDGRAARRGGAPEAGGEATARAVLIVHDVDQTEHGNTGHERHNVEDPIRNARRAVFLAIVRVLHLLLQGMKRIVSR